MARIAAALAGLVFMANFGGCTTSEAPRPKGQVAVNVSMLTAPPGCSVHYDVTFYDSTTSPMQLLGTKSYDSSVGPDYRIIDEVAFAGGIQVSTQISATLNCPNLTPSSVPGSCYAEAVNIPNVAF